MRNFSTKFLLAASLLMVFAAALTAQTAATVTGAVTDASGAILPGTMVVIANPSTGAEFKTTTNSAGSYRFGEIPPGPGYTMTFTHDGFATYSVKDVYVNVANSRTQNAKLTPGTNETVEVTASSQGVTINTEDATIGNNFEVQQLNELPVQSRNTPAALFTLQPGITSSGATTGARTDQTNATLDGLDVNDFATGSFGAVIGGAPVDSVQEFRGTTAGFTANSGQGGGGQFQMVTKGGTNHFHGNANWYHRDNSTTANNWFNTNIPVQVRAPKLVRNQFGGSVGGPIKHDKAFFFFNYNAGRISQQATQTRTVPLPSFVAGNVSYILNTAGCKSNSRQDTTPNCIGHLTPDQVKAKDPAGIGESPALINLLKRYPAANDVTLGDGINTGIFRFNAATPDNLSGYVGRIDYNLTSKIKIFGRGSVVRENQIRTAQQFPGDLPTAQFVDRSYAYVVGANWQISQNKYNQLAYGTTVADLSFPRPANALGVNQVSFASGTTTLLTAPYASPSNSQARHIPIPQITDDFNWLVGRHSLSIGGFFKWIHSNSSTVLDYNSDTVGLGGQTQGFTAAFRPADILPNGAQPGGVNNGTVAGVTFDSAYAAILGRVGAVNTTFNYDKTGTALPLATGNNRNYQYYQTLTYVSDSWKVTPHLTLTYGFNYQIFSVPYEKNGLETVQATGFDDYMRARVAQSAASNTSANGVPFFTYLLGGPANKGPDVYHQSWKDIAPRFAFAYVPSFDPKTVFSGGIGMEYDRTVVQGIQFQQEQYSYLFTQTASHNFGSSTNGAGLLATDPRLDSPPTNNPPATPKAPYTPYVTAGGIPTGLVGSIFNEMVDPNLKTPYSISMNFGMQHEFPGALVLKVAYAGRLGRRLLAQADSSQLVDFTDQASGETMGQAMTSLELKTRAGANPLTMAPEPYFEHLYAPLLADKSACGPPGTYRSVTNCIADGSSSLLGKGDFADIIQGIAADGIGYNQGMASQLSENTMYTNKGFSTYSGLLLSLSKNITHGLQFDVNYTWSHSMDNVSLTAGGVAYGGYGFICDVLRPRLCRGNSDFDVTHIVTSDFTYRLPFGRGRTFGGSSNWAVNSLLGGWDISGIPSWQSGLAYTAVTSAFVAGYSNNAPAIFNGNSAVLAHRVHKSGSQLYLYDNPQNAVNAFSAPTGFNIGSRNTLRGPQYFNFDAGVQKSFAAWPREGVNVKLRGDAFNVLNHPSFNAPATNSLYDDITNPSQFGQLSSTANGARVLQLVLRVEF